MTPSRKAAQKRYYTSEKGRNGMREYRNRPTSRAKDRERKLLKKYGVNLAQYNDMLEAQNHACGICEVHQSKLAKRLAVDHNHANGKVRGLLCTTCNLAIGKFKDDIKLLIKAIAYLKKHLGGS